MARRRATLSVGVVVLAIATVLWVSVSSQAGPEILPAEVLSEPMTIPPGTETSLVFQPPEADYTPPLTAEEALSISGKIIDPSEATSVKATLALFTNPTYRPVTPDGDPTGPPLWEKLPVWLVTVDGICAGDSGGGFILPDQSSPQKLEPCPNHEVNIIIDATTGEYLMDISYQ